MYTNSPEYRQEILQYIKMKGRRQNPPTLKPLSSGARQQTRSHQRMQKIVYQTLPDVPTAAQQRLDVLRPDCIVVQRSQNEEAIAAAAVRPGTLAKIPERSLRVDGQQIEHITDDWQNW